MTEVQFYEMYRAARDYRRFQGGLADTIIKRDTDWQKSRSAAAMTVRGRPGIARSIETSTVQADATAAC